MICTVFQNKNIAEKPEENLAKCNCRVKKDCPLNNNCKVDNLVNQAELTEQGTGAVSSYVGLCSTTFKRRYYNHQKSFVNEEYLHDSKLSEYIWQLRRSGIGYDVSWKALDRGKPFSPHMGICQLCTREKYF